MEQLLQKFTPRVI